MLKRFGLTTAALLAALAVVQPNMASAMDRDNHVQYRREDRSREAQRERELRARELREREHRQLRRLDFHNERNEW